MWNPEKKLYYHIWDEDTKTYAIKRFWGVGNGWAAAGMNRVVEILPETMKEEKDQIIEFVNAVIDGCLSFQREDGLYHDILDDPSTDMEAAYRDLVGI